MSDHADWMTALQSSDRQARRQAAEQLSQFPEQVPARPGVVPLVRAAADEDEAVREWAVAALEGMGAPHPDDAPGLAPLLSEDDGDVAYWAATLLGRLAARGAAAVPQLAAALQAQPHLSVRQRAAWALGRMGAAARPAQSALQSAAQDPDARLARLATDALRRIADD